MIALSRIALERAQSAFFFISKKNTSFVIKIAFFSFSLRYTLDREVMFEACLRLCRGHYPRM